MRLHLVCLWRHLLLYGDYLEKVMSGKLVKDISRETIDKLLSMLCLTLQYSHLGFSLFSGRPKQSIMITSPCTSCFPLQNISKCLLFTSMSTVYIKLFLGAGRRNSLKWYFCFPYLLLQQNQTPSFNKKHDLHVQYNSNTIKFFLPENVGRE